MERAVNGMESILSPPKSYPDVAHQINALTVEMGHNLACINCAVEESTISARSPPVLMEQDRLVQKSVREGVDFVVICSGGNDVVLRPTLSTIASLISLLCCSSESSLADGSAWGLNHFVSLFRDAYGDYIRRLCVNKPKAVVVCMVYYPQHSLPGVHSWADGSLGMMGYNRDPENLKRVMQAVFNFAVKRITPPEGTILIPLALYDVLDPGSAVDYIERVEPSKEGGAKMAAAILKSLQPYL